MRKIYLITFGVLCLVLVTLFVVRPNIKVNDHKYTVKLLVSGYLEHFTITDSSANTSLGQFSEGEISLQLAVGVHDLVFASNGLDSVLKQVVVPVKDSKVSTVSFTPNLGPAEVLNDVVGESKNINNTNAKYFAKDTWLVGNTTSTTAGSEESYTVVAKLQAGKWVSVVVGSFIDTDTLLHEGAPPDLIAYLEGIQ